MQAPLASIVHTDGRNGDGVSFVRAEVVDFKLHLAANGYELTLQALTSSRRIRLPLLLDQERRPLALWTLTPMRLNN